MDEAEWPSPQLELLAWRDFMDFAIGNPEVRAAFTAETGMRFAETQIDLLIDDATGYSEDTIRRFVVWATENHWGPMPELMADKWKGAAS